MRKRVLYQNTWERRRCNVCGEAKKPEEFTLRRDRGKPYRRAVCRECWARYCRAYRRKAQAHPESVVHRPRVKHDEEPWLCEPMVTLEEIEATLPGGLPVCSVREVAGQVFYLIR